MLKFNHLLTFILNVHKPHFKQYKKLIIKKLLKIIYANLGICNLYQFSNNLNKFKYNQRLLKTGQVLANLLKMTSQKIIILQTNK